MPKPKTRVLQKRNGSQFSLWSPLKVAADDQGELLREGTGSPTAEEQHLALELLGILRSAIARSSIVLSPGEGLEIVRLEMDAWSPEGRDELRMELVSCLERLAETNKRRSGEAETTSYAHVKSLEMRFHPRANAASSGDADGLNSRESLEYNKNLYHNNNLKQGEADRRGPKAGRGDRAEGTQSGPDELVKNTPPATIRAVDLKTGTFPTKQTVAPARSEAAIEEFITQFERLATTNPEEAIEVARRCTAIAFKYQPPEVQRTLDVNAAMQLTKLSRTRIQQLPRKMGIGELVGGRLMFTERELRQYLETRKPRGRPIKNYPK